MTIHAILTDIEGTTSSIDFVKTVLFPYAAQALPAYLRQYGDRPEVAAELATVRQLLGQPDATLEGVTQQLLDWIAADQKITPLKTLQGLIWQQGFVDHVYTAHLYADAYSGLKAWHDQGLNLYVYSSGSIFAQKLFFGHSDYGDLTPWFSGFFDTTTGPKRDPASYHAIAQTIGLPAARILFLSDVPEELDAAQSVGMQTTWLVRPDDRPSTEAERAASVHPWVTSFADIAIAPLRNTD